MNFVNQYLNSNEGHIGSSHQGGCRASGSASYVQKDNIYKDFTFLKVSELSRKLAFLINNLKILIRLQKKILNKKM